MTGSAAICLVLALLCSGSVSVAAPPLLEGYDDFTFAAGTPARRDWAEEYIVTAVTHELTELGLVAGQQGADVLVRTHVLVGKHSAQDLEDPDYFALMAGVKSVEPYDLAEATLVVDLEDAASGERIWRGVQQAGLKDSPRRDARRIDRFVRKMFR